MRVQFVNIPTRNNYNYVCIVPEIYFKYILSENSFKRNDTM